MAASGAPDRPLKDTGVNEHVFVCGMSRSGTTLLATVLDSHPGISMGYELLPAGLPALDEIERLLASALEGAAGDAERCGDALQAAGHRNLGTFIKRCGRALVPPEQLRRIVAGLAAEPAQDMDSIAMRMRISLAVAAAKMRTEGTGLCGFKINAPSIEAFDAVAPGGRYAFIVRDPRDVVASHFAARFDRTVDHITRAWQLYTSRFLAFAAGAAGRATMVRYEDLVTRPEPVLRAMFDAIGVPFDPAVLRFFDSKASIHQGGHVNDENLKRPFYRDSIGRWPRELSLEQVREVQDACGELMETTGYVPAPTETPSRLGWIRRQARNTDFEGKRKFYRDEYATLLESHAAGLVNLTWRDAAAGREAAGRGVLIIRHDVDHDYETALCMARMEHGRGLRATYCILHSAWYYGMSEDGRMQRTREVVDCCLELQSLGHEVNLHNNFPATALRHGGDARRMLEQELHFLRLHGIEIAGTSTHGDALCRQLDFRNYEIFSESVYPSRGGPRTVEHGGNRVNLGAVSMSEFGLEYEAYDIPRDVYVTDSGGTLRQRRNTRGRAGKRRAEMGQPPPYPAIVGILTHPIWWDFHRDAPRNRSFPVPEVLAASPPAPAST